MFLILKVDTDGTTCEGCQFLKKWASAPRMSGGTESRWQCYLYKERVDSGRCGQCIDAELKVVD